MGWERLVLGLRELGPSQTSDILQDDPSMGTFTSLEILHSPHERDSEFRQSPATDRQAVRGLCNAGDQRRFLAAELALHPPVRVSRHSLSLQLTANSTACRAPA